MKITITQGLDLSLQGSPKESGFLKRIDPAFVSVDLRPYSALALKLKVEPGDDIHSGAPVAEYKNFPGVFITSPISGTVTEIRRGEKRSLLDVLIQKTPGQDRRPLSAPGRAHGRRRADGKRAHTARRAGHHLARGNLQSHPPGGAVRRGSVHSHHRARRAFAHQHGLRQQPGNRHRGLWRHLSRRRHHRPHSAGKHPPVPPAHRVGHSLCHR